MAAPCSGAGRPRCTAATRPTRAGEADPWRRGWLTRDRVAGVRQGKKTQNKIAMGDGAEGEERGGRQIRQTWGGRCWGWRIKASAAWFHAPSPPWWCCLPACCLQGYGHSWVGAVFLLRPLDRPSEGFTGTAPKKSDCNRRHENFRHRPKLGNSTHKIPSRPGHTLNNLPWYT